MNLIDSNYKNIREFKVNGKKIDFSNSFNDLHTESYKNIIKKKGFGINDVEDSIKTVNLIKKIKLSEKNDDEVHPLLKLINKND